MSIIDIATDKDKHIVFVSGDEKNDWFHRSENQSLYPRFELLTEFKSKTDNKSFHIIKLSQLLTSFDADETAVKEVQIKERVSFVSFNEYRAISHEAVQIVFNWLINTEPQGEVTQNQGFPDFTLKDNDKTEGIEVMVIRGNRRIPPMPRFMEQFHRAYFEVSNGNFDCFRIIIVGLGSDFSPSLINDYIERNGEKYKNEFVRITIGIINESSEFEPLNNYP